MWDERKRAQDQSFCCRFLFLTIFFLLCFIFQVQVNQYSMLVVFILFLFFSFISFIHVLPSIAVYLSTRSLTRSLLPHGAFVYYKIFYCHCYSIFCKMYFFLHKYKINQYNTLMYVCIYILSAAKAIKKINSKRFSWWWY